MRIGAALTLVAAAALGGCSALPTLRQAQGDTVTAQGDMGEATARVRSWMLPPNATARASLIYLSDFSGGVVHVYDYGSGREAGELSGFTTPDGECVDAKGDVYIADYEGSEIDEFAHGGTTRLKTYRTRGFPISCSVDRRGDLAATSFRGASSSEASDLCVWKHGSTSADCYTDTVPCYFMWGPGYDDKGNVIVEGQGEFNQKTAICALRRGASKMTALSYDGTIYFPGGVTWDGKYIALTDQLTSAAGNRAGTGIYQATLSGSSLHEIGKTVLKGSCNGGTVDVVMPFVVGNKNTPVNESQGHVVIGGNLDCSGRDTSLWFWRYPRGREYKSYPIASFEPNGQVVSIPADVSKARGQTL